MLSAEPESHLGTVVPDARVLPGKNRVTWSLDPHVLSKIEHKWDLGFLISLCSTIAEPCKGMGSQVLEILMCSAKSEPSRLGSFLGSWESFGIPMCSTKFEHKGVQDSRCSQVPCVLG